MNIRVRLGNDSVEINNIPAIDTSYDGGFNNTIKVLNAAIKGLKDAQQPKKSTLQ